MGKWAGQPTNFIEKVWSGLYHEGMFGPLERISFDEEYKGKFGRFWDSWYTPETTLPKLHTLREDPNDRWYAGRGIQFAINPQSKNYFQFAPTIPCVSVQPIQIKEMLMTSSSHCYPTKNDRIMVIEVDGIRLKRTQIEELAINDGFESAEQLFAWFNKDWEGKIIHWTDLRY